MYFLLSLLPRLHPTQDVSLLVPQNRNFIFPSRGNKILPRFGVTNCNLHLVNAPPTSLPTQLPVTCDLNISSGSSLFPSFFLQQHYKRIITSMTNWGTIYTHIISRNYSSKKREFATKGEWLSSVWEHCVVCEQCCISANGNEFMGLILTRILFILQLS